ncbi:hypothetical protein L210DRAFT_3638530 [Boletus edulis BED1]|uniref:Uncharacterized protein n=1 Tax=Boletus edulis BED1 TaxID=1328754 RepID=A0AAD4C8I5_BOLED|nr:hypothetical protein L210DRAFT_3638530 [Boletus edulis BED1]
MRTRYSRQSPHIKIRFINYLPVELLPSISSQPVTHWVYCKDDIAFEHFHSSHLGFLQAIIVFMAGEHPDAISRLDDLIACAIRFRHAYVYLPLGKPQMERNDYEGAMHSFACTSPNAGRCWASPLCNLTSKFLFGRTAYRTRSTSLTDIRMGI